MGYLNTGCGGTGGGGGTPSYPGNDFELFFRSSNTLASSSELTFIASRLRTPNVSINSNNTEARLDVFGGGTFSDIITRFRAQPSNMWFDLRGTGNLGIGDYAEANAWLKVKSDGGNFSKSNILARNTFNSVIFDVRNNGRIGLGTDAIDTAHMVVPASTAGVATMNLTNGANVSAPNDGDLWYNGTNLNFRRGSTTFDLLVNIPVENGWIPYTNNAGNYTYNQYFKWLSGTVESPQARIGNGPAVTITPNDALIQMKSQHSTFAIPAFTYENNFFGIRYDMRTNGNIGMGGNAAVGSRLNIIPDSGSALRINAGGVPTSPENGDIWVNFDKIYIRLAGVTKEFAFV